jgi:hypothetical protein
MTKYCHPLPPPKDLSDPTVKQTFDMNVKAHEEISGWLRTIINDYKFLSLGVKMNIVDEDFLYKAAKGAGLLDWKSLSQIVIAYRQKYTNPRVYIEFEGLVNAWEQDKYI